MPLALEGSMTALLTPFRNGQLDARALQALCAWQIAEGTDALVAVGSTGESATLSHAEHRQVVELCLEVAKGRVPVIAGAYSNDTSAAIALTQHAQRAGADAVLQVVPYYNRPTQEGMYRHIKAIHDASDIPIVLYNVPGRVVVDMSAETVARLAELPRVVAIKDATNDLSRPARTRLLAGADFIQLSGEDATVIPFLANGGHGSISVTANVAPRLLAELHDAWRIGDLARARRINDRLMPLHAALFAETSPAPAKYAASLLGLCAPDCRLPMVPLAPETAAKVESAMTRRARQLRTP